MAHAGSSICSDLDGQRLCMTTDIIGKIADCCISNMIKYENIRISDNLLLDRPANSEIPVNFNWTGFCKLLYTPHSE